MKKTLLLLIAMAVLAFGVTSKALAEDEECPCGTDEDGECIPCEE